jgi:protein ImuA
MRWRIASAPSLPNPLDPKAPGAPAWDAELFRARGFVPGRWSIACDVQSQELVVAHDRAQDRLGLVAPAGDRALVEGERRVG